MAVIQKKEILVIGLLALAVFGCAPVTNSNTTFKASLTPTPEPKFEPDRAFLIDQTESTAVYIFYYNENDPESAYLCLWNKDDGHILLAQTGENIRWFLNAVILDSGVVVYSQYMNQIELAEIWTADENGENKRLLVSTEVFVTLGEGFARAVPNQMIALPEHNQILFNTSEFGYKAETLNDLYLLDIDSGALTTLLAPGEGGKLLPQPDEGVILILNRTQILALDVISLEIQPATFLPPIEMAKATPPKNEPWHQNCAP